MCKKYDVRNELLVQKWQIKTLKKKKKMREVFNIYQRALKCRKTLPAGQEPSVSVSKQAQAFKQLRYHQGTNPWRGLCCREDLKNRIHGQFGNFDKLIFSQTCICHSLISLYRKWYLLESNCIDINGLIIIDIWHSWKVALLQCTFYRYL